MEVNKGAMIVWTLMFIAVYILFTGNNILAGIFAALIFIPIIIAVFLWSVFTIDIVEVIQNKWKRFKKNATKNR